MTQNKYTQGQLEGAESLITKGLRLKAEQQLLLFYQEEFESIALCIEWVANQKGVPVVKKSFSKEVFRNRYPEAFSMYSVSLSRPQPKGIALLIEWSEETTASRLALLRNLTSERHGWRIASMPGVNLKDLPSCISDFEIINKHSKSVFAILSRASKAIIETRNPKGEVDTLTVPIKKYYPIISTGEIQENSWGNFPSGETFKVPDEFTASGWVTVRGSIPHYPLRANEWIQMELVKGRIRSASISASSEELKQKFLSLFFNSNQKAKSINANSLAELGIGTNPGIEQLTGMPIFDEKKLGTVHIAFGMNDQFGGPLKAKVHHDIVCTDANLLVINNGWLYEVLRAGEFVLDSTAALPDFTTLPSHALDGRSGKKLSLGTVSYDCSSSKSGTHSIKINYKSTRDDVTFTVASGATALIGTQILDLFRDSKTVSISKAIRLITAANSDVDKTAVKKIIFGLVECRVLKMVG